MLKNDDIRTARDQRERSKQQSVEHDHQVAFFQILELNSRKYPQLVTGVFAVPNGGFRDQATAKKLKAEGVRRGVPDILIMIPRRGYFAAAIENKAPAGRLSPEQKQMLDSLNANGYMTKICYSVDEQVKFLEWYLGIELVRK